MNSRFICLIHNVYIVVVILAKNLSFIDGVFILKKGLFNKIKLLIKINLLKIDKLLILDGKDRSIFFSFFILLTVKLR